MSNPLSGLLLAVIFEPILVNNFTLFIKLLAHLFFKDTPQPGVPYIRVSVAA
jgi:hypothetical protein